MSHFRMTSIIAPSILGLFLSHCSLKTQANAVQSKAAPAMVSSDKTYLSSTSVSDEALKTFADTNNAFAFSLYSKEATSVAENIVISPFSIQSAFALLYPGSSTTAEDEISKALSFSLPQSGFHESMKAQLLQYQSAIRSADPKDKDAAKLDLKIVNDVWVEKTRTLQSDFLDTVKVFYNTGVRPLDFATKPLDAEITINDYISDATKGLIKDLIPKGSLDKSTAVVLTNAIYLLADWAKPFEKENTQENIDFKTPDGTVSKVTMMNQQDHFQYAETDLYQAVSLPYTGGKLAMMVILPKQIADLKKTEAALDAKAWADLLKNTSTEEVLLSLPKFTMKWGSNSLKPALKELGLSSVFDDSSQSFPKLLKPIDPAEYSYIADVFHQATIIVDEKGTTASAATAVIISTESTAAPAEDPTPPKVVNVNHPMMFVLYDTQSGSIMFMGHLANPK